LWAREGLPRRRESLDVARNVASDPANGVRRLRDDRRDSFGLDGTERTPDPLLTCSLAEVTKAGDNPEVVLEATYGWYWRSMCSPSSVVRCTWRTRPG